MLTPNIVLWGNDTHVLEDDDDDEDMHKLNKRLRMAREHEWKRWRKGNLHSLMESHRINRKTAVIPEIGEIVLVVDDEKNKGLRERLESCDTSRQETES